MGWSCESLIKCTKACIFVSFCLTTLPLRALGETTSCDPKPSSHVEEPMRCYQGSCWHLGPYFKFVPICIYEVCHCYAPNYSNLTCLPSVGSCHIRKFEDDVSGVHAIPFDSSPYGPGTVYSCIGKGGLHSDVHVLAVNEADGQPRFGPLTAKIMFVTIISSTTLIRPVIVVLTNHQPVDWLLSFQPTLEIKKVILITPHPDESSVTTASGVNQSLVIEKWPRSTPQGYGTDFGGGNTAEMLAILTEKFGAVASFAGAYRTKSWEWYLPSVCHEIAPLTISATPHNKPATKNASVPSESTPTYNDEPISCLNNRCWHVGSPFRFNASCFNGHCRCNAPNYNDISCLPSVGLCQIRTFERESEELHARPSNFPFVLPHTVYSCTGDGSISTNVHVLGVHEGFLKTVPPTASRVIVTILSSASDVRPVTLVLTNHEPVDWNLEFEPHLNIEKVILITPYTDLSSVTPLYGDDLLNVEKRPSDTPGGYGTDRDGGNTAQMLVDLTEEFGAITSFAGTYKANYWFLNLTALYDGTTEEESTTVSTTSSTLNSAQGVIPCYIWHGRETCFHVGSPFRFETQCVNGFCECHAPLYDTFTCLPSVGSCQIRPNPPDLHATPIVSRSSTPTVYGCIGQEGANANVHVLGVYEGNVHTRPPRAGTINVVISSSPTSTRPVILVFTSYEPVNWILHYPHYLAIEKVILIAYYSDQSRVTTANGISQSFIVEKKPRGTARGYGSDRGGGSTAEMLADLQEEFGAVTSFAGTYRADSWTWTLPNVDAEINQTPTMAVTQSNDDMIDVTEDAWTEYAFRFEDNWNSCHGSQYVRRRSISDSALGRYIGVILCTSDRYKLVMADDLNDEFKNIADESGAGEDHCEFVGAPSKGTVDSNFWDSPSATGYYRAFWGDDMTRGMIGGGLGESWTGLYYPTWYECGVSIP